MQLTKAYEVCVTVCVIRMYSVQVPHTTSTNLQLDSVARCVPDNSELRGVDMCSVCMGRVV